MEITYKKVKDLTPYINNSRTHTEKQVDEIVASINEYGFTNPILIDENDNIIAGHGRLLASKKLNMAEVPCIVLSGLTEAQKKAYVIADNKMALNASWNKDLLKEEFEKLSDLDFDLSLTGFSDEEIDKIFEDKVDYGGERARTNSTYNLDIVDFDGLTNDFWQMPIIKNNGFIPKDLIGFNYAKTSPNKRVGIHFYVDDYQFERLWNAPEKYVDILLDYDCILSPDFSLYLDMPMPMKIWNIYRSRQIGAFYQSKGIKVIPTISWAEEETYQFAFQGIPTGSIVSVSTIGVKTDERAFYIWKNGMDAMIKTIQPTTILIYGGKVDYDYGDINVIYFDNKITERMKEG